MPVRAKFVCSSVKKYATTTWIENNPTPGFAYEYEFYVVAGKDGENAKFFASTPSGSLKMSAVRDDLFVPGQSYYLDFSAAPANS